MPKLAERAREEQWSHERFLEAVLSTEVASRESHGGETRIKAARFPARKTLEEFDFTFQRSVKKQVVEHLGQLDFLHGNENVVLLGPPGPARPTWRSRSGSAPASPASGSPSRPRPSGSRASARQSARASSRHELAPPLADPAARRRRGRLHPLRPRGREPDVQPRLGPLRARLADRHLEQGLLGLGRDLRRRGRRRGDDRPARPPRRDPRRSRATPTGFATRTSARRRPATERPACSASPYGLRSAGGLPILEGGHFSTGAKGSVFDRP